MAYQRTRTINTETLYDFKESYITAGRPLRYVENKRYLRRVTRGYCSPSYQGFSLAAHGGFELSPNAEALLQSMAYSKFMDALKGSTSSVGNAIGEWRSSYDMIARRAIQLRSALTAFRRGEILRAANLLSVPEDTVRKASVLARTKRGRWRKADDGASVRHWASSLWLETYFGWLPMIGDIHDSLQVLSDPIRNLVDVKGKSASLRDPNLIDARYGENRDTGMLIWGDVEKRANYYAKVEVSNPNLFLANRMGLVNPASIAWELTPFSFVVDWFTNVGQIIESMTDFAGITVREAGYTTKRTTTLTRQEYWPPGQLNNSVHASTVEFLRQPGSIARPPLAFRSPLGSLTRAITQISLLNGYINIDRSVSSLRTR